MDAYTDDSYASYLKRPDSGAGVAFGFDRPEYPGSLVGSTLMALIKMTGIDSLIKRLVRIFFTCLSDWNRS